MSSYDSGPVTVRAPATCANLGPGFDALGLALDLYDDVTATLAGDRLVIDVTGHGADLPRDESHLVVRAMRATFARLDAHPSGIAMSCTNNIPHGRGLGSSAAAIVAGVLLARELTPDGPQRLSAQDALALASELEGHPDNVAACLLGGLSIAWTEQDGPGRVAHAIRVDCADRIRPVVFVPPFEASTEHARGLLPATVPHADAAFAAGRAALLIAALTTSTDSLFAATEDRLHQSYRAPAMPESAELMAALRGAGFAAVISGAGPTVLALTTSDPEAEAAIGTAPEGWTARKAAISRVGAQIVR